MTEAPHLALVLANLPAAGELSLDLKGWCLFHINSGIAYLLHGRTAADLKAGEVIIANSPEKVTIRASQLTDVEIEYFGVIPELLNGFFTPMEQHYLRTQDRNTGWVRTIAANDPLALKFAQILAASPKPSERLLRCDLLRLFAHLLAGEMPETAPAASEAVAGAQTRFRRLMDEMAAAELENHSVGELARKCGCSERHFSRLFRQQFGVSIRAKQMEMRLQKAQRLLRDSDTKIIYVAMESGFRHLGLFNSMFKRRFGMTPSAWRNPAGKKESRRRNSRMLAPLLLFLSVMFTNAGTLEQSNSAATTNGPVFSVKHYEVEGNSVLPAKTIEKIMEGHTGEHISLEEVKNALTELQLAYRGRGFVSVSVTLPQQQLTNGIVKLRVIEGKISDIIILGNRYFSSNNIRSALPYLQTNIILNSHLFSYELDLANASRDRSIFPVIGPGPEPGTTAITLKIKDRFPLHGRLDIDNQSTPGTPNLRINGSAQYNNLWQKEHQVGVQYMFTPEDLKGNDPHFFEQPLITSYSGFYRMPLSSQNVFDPGTDGGTGAGSFGYDEVTRQFRLPPATGKSELIVYGSRSSSDTGSQLAEETLTPPSVPPEGALQVSSAIYNQTLVENENLGFRVVRPMKTIRGINSTFGAGLDLKAYYSKSLQTRFSGAALYIPPAGSTFGPPFNVFPAPSTPPSTRTLPDSVTYLPISLSWDGSLRDKQGVTSVSLNQSFNYGGLLDHEASFQSIARSQKASGTYFQFNVTATREQTLYEEWSLLLRMNGQWASQPLISNEQFGIGGFAGVRGYRDGQEYGDTGWRMTFEPRTPLVDIGMVDGTMPTRVRFSLFTDYGERYLIDPGNRPGTVRMWGAGFALAGTIGESFDFRFSYALPLLDIPGVTAGSGRFYFLVGAQF